jgi:hypothetical protein
VLIGSNENWKEKAQLISSRWRFLSTGLRGRAALSSLLGELLFPASPPEKQQVSNYDYAMLVDKYKKKESLEGTKRTSSSSCNGIPG